MQDTINAVTHLQRALERFDVDIAGAVACRLREDQIDELDDGRLSIVIQNILRPFQVMGQAPQRLPNVWEAIKQYLTQTFPEVEPMYELEKAGEFNPDKPRPKGTDFIVAELSRAGTFLGSLWYTAWLESGEPVPTPKAK